MPPPQDQIIFSDAQNIQLVMYLGSLIYNIIFVHLDQGSGFCVTGKIEAGYIQTGDRILAMPPNETCTVKGKQIYLLSKNNLLFLLLRAFWPSNHFWKFCLHLKL